MIHTAIDTFDRIYDNIQQTSALIDQMVDKINQVDEVATQRGGNFGGAGGKLR